MKRFKKVQHGFTLIELLIVVAILAVVAAVAIPNLSRFVGSGGVEAFERDKDILQELIHVYMIEEGVGYPTRTGGAGPIDFDSLITAGYLPEIPSSSVFDGGDYIWEIDSDGSIITTYDEQASFELLLNLSLDEGAGDVAHDLSFDQDDFRENDGTLSNYPSWITGKVGSALNFDINSYANCGNDSSLDVTDAITVEAWMNTYVDGWNYARPITLAPAAPDDDYQVKVELTTLNFDYSRAQDDGDDLRFYDCAGSPLSYWIENWDASGTSTVWVKTRTAGTSSIYMYYGNTSASSASDGTQTFEFFDDFEAATLDTDKWDTNGGAEDGYSITDGVIEIWMSDYTVYSKTDITNTDKAVMSRIKRISGGDFDSGVWLSYNGGNSGIGCILDDAGSGHHCGICYANWANLPILFTGAIGVDEWQDIEIWRIGNTVYASAFGETISTTVANQTVNPVGLWADGDAESRSAYFEYIAVRKCASSEPSATVGNERHNGWKYKRSITLAPTTPEDNYQVKIELTTLNFDYSNAQDDGDDLRFYDSAGNPLSYWIENWDTSGTSTVWIKVPTSGTSTVDMYYGNPIASSASNGDDTFNVFLNFTRDGVVSHGGGSQDIDTNDWEIIDDTTIRMWNNNWKACERDFSSTGDGSQVISFSFKSVGIQGEVDGVGLDNDSGITSGSFYHIYGTQSWGLIDHDGYTGGGNWQNYNLLLDDFSGDFNRFVFANDADAAQATDIYYKDIRIRKYNSSEPVSTVGAEANAVEGISKTGAYGIGANTTTAQVSINDQILTASLSAGWNHIVLTYDKDAGGNDEMKLYVNGIEEATADYSTEIVITSNDLLIGATAAFTGIVDEVRIYDRALTAGEVQTRYDETS
ncbi:MAG: DUF2341 domain-containing protein [Chloroflexota bacterium]|nr:DUF2341 domain-containing protein [Chloroflexota bacterium]